MSSADVIREAVDNTYRTESRRVLATLIRLLGDFDLAEEAMQDAFAAALDVWSRDGIPANPRSWLISTGRFKGIDSLRKRSRAEGSTAELLRRIEENAGEIEEGHDIEDDRLRLIFTCCHPALAPDAQIALTLREVCGLTTEEIARAFFTKPSAVAQRIVRAKSKIREARIPYQLPPASELSDRLDTVLHTIYLVFNEGYSASGGTAPMREPLCEEAIRLARLLMRLFPGEPEIMGLAALMLLQHARATARFDENGSIILLEDQDRTKWDREMIAEGLALIDKAMRHRRPGAYLVQAAIAA